LDECTGAGAVAEIFPGPFEGAPLRVVNPLLDKVLGNARGGLLKTLFAACEQRALQTLAKTTALKNAIQSYDRDDFKSAGGHAKLGRKVHLFASRTGSPCPFASFTCTCRGTQCQTCSETYKRVPRRQARRARRARNGAHGSNSLAKSTADHIFSTNRRSVAVLKVHPHTADTFAKSVLSICLKGGYATQRRDFKQAPATTRNASEKLAYLGSEST
jgi:hypothetical protein